MVWGNGRIHIRIDAISEAKQKHVPQLKRKEQKWNFCPNIKCCSRSIDAVNTVQCANMRLCSVDLGWACFKWIPADLSMFGFDTDTLARTHWLFSWLYCALCRPSHLFSHREWHAIIITNEQINKYRFRVYGKWSHCWDTFHSGEMCWLPAIGE